MMKNVTKVISKGFVVLLALVFASSASAGVIIYTESFSLSIGDDDATPPETEVEDTTLGDGPSTGSVYTSVMLPGFTGPGTLTNVMLRLRSEWEFEVSAEDDEDEGGVGAISKGGTRLTAALAGSSVSRQFQEVVLAFCFGDMDDQSCEDEQNRSGSFNRMGSISNPGALALFAGPSIKFDLSNEVFVNLLGCAGVNKECDAGVESDWEGEIGVKYAFDELAVPEPGTLGLLGLGLLGLGFARRINKS